MLEKTSLAAVCLVLGACSGANETADGTTTVNFHLPRGGASAVSFHTLATAAGPRGAQGAAAALATLTTYADDDGMARLYLRDVDPTATGGTLSLDCIDDADNEDTVTLSVVVHDAAVTLPAAPYAKAGKPVLTVLASDPSSATAGEIFASGYPPRPALGTADYADWLRVVRSGATVITPHIFIDPTQGQAPAGMIPAPSGQSDDGIGSSDNWSGYTISTRDDAPPYAAVYGAWNVPQAYGEGGDVAWDHSSIWVGLDGAPPTTDVVQSGSEHDTLSAGWLEASAYNAWTEWFPIPCQVIANFPVAPGDELHTWVSVTDASGAPSAAPTVAWFYLWNATENLYTRRSLGIPSGITFGGHSAEWILERPSSNGALTGLAEYASPTSLFNAAAYDAAGAAHDYTSDSSRRISMVDDENAKALLSSVAPVSATEMQFTWHANL